MALLHRQVQELQCQAEEAWVASTRIIKLEAKLHETVTQDREMFVQGQDSIKKGLLKGFSTEDFS